MIFDFSSPAAVELSEICAWNSEHGLWRVGLLRVLYGVRVFVAPAGDCGYELVYCAGRDLSLIAITLVAVIRALHQFPESISCNKLGCSFPRQDIKPIDKDPDCLGKLLEMSAEAPEDFPCPNFAPVRSQFEAGLIRVANDYSKLWEEKIRE